MDPPPLNLQQKLGHLYEDALAHVLAASPRHAVLERNLQIQKDAHTTAGELDFLLQDSATDRLIHLELAIKFYLAVETNDGITLPGPDARDNYARKLHRLRSHQLTLPVRYRASLPIAYRNQTIVSEQLIQGCLFDHIHVAANAKPDHRHPNARQGRWLHIDELAEHFTDTTSFHLIPKVLWPVSIERLAGIPLVPWIPSRTIDRCVMLRVENEPLPYFVAPTGYGEHVRSSHRGGQS